MTNADLIRQRFAAQHLSGAGLRQPDEVVAWLVAMQAQDFAGAKWSIGQRVHDGRMAEVEAALDRGTILRTHILRQTWHFVTASDIRWLLALTSPRVHALNGTYYRRFELDDALHRRSHAIFRRVLRDGQYLTRPELARWLADDGIVGDTVRLSFIVMHAELEGLICSGPMRGKQHTYALLDERAAPTPPLAREEALARLTLGFLRSHGPATLTDLSWWCSLSLADVRAGVALLGGALASTIVDGHTFWFDAAMPTAPDPPPMAHLVPEYDESHLPFKGTGALDLPHANHGTWNDAWYRPVLVGLRRAGTWQRTISRAGLRIDTDLFATLDRDQRALLEQAVQRYGRFLNVPARLGDGV